MNKSVFSFLLTVLFATAVFAQDEIKLVKIEDLKKVYIKPNDTTYIINFFATWCGACMMEMQILNTFYDGH